MSKENEKVGTRRYRKRRRAEQEDATRQRITEATVDLHGSVGPARTTVSAVAERAGVQRGTVYRHFPDEAALFEACSSHWLSENPLPDLSAWAEIADPGRRLATALGELYAWFDRGEYMLEKTTRDVAVVPALQPSMEAFGAWLDAAADALMRGREERGGRRRIVRAAIVHSLGFSTWRSLVREGGLRPGTAVELMVGMIGAAARPPGE